MNLQKHPLGIFFTRFLSSPRHKYFIHPTAIITGQKNLKIGGNAQIWEYAIIRAPTNVSIGKYSQIGPFTVLLSGEGITIGDNVMIGPHCVLAAGNHDYKQVAVPMRFAGDLSSGPIVIEDNVWIGANCTITDGVVVGHNAVVAANSVVTKNVSPYDIVAGSPAKKIGNRKQS